MLDSARLTREYCPNERLDQIPFRYTVGFERIVHDIMVEVNSHRIMMENLRTMDENRRAVVIERHPVIIRTSILLFMHLGTCSPCTRQ